MSYDGLQSADKLIRINLKVLKDQGNSLLLDAQHWQKVRLLKHVRAEKDAGSSIEFTLLASRDCRVAATSSFILVAHPSSNASA